MENKKETPKHSVGKGAQNEKYNAEKKQSYVKNPTNENSKEADKAGDY